MRDLTFLIGLVDRQMRKQAASAGWGSWSSPASRPENASGYGAAAPVVAGVDADRFENDNMRSVAPADTEGFMQMAPEEYTTFFNEVLRPALQRAYTENIDQTPGLSNGRPFSNDAFFNSTTVPKRLVVNVGGFGSGGGSAAAGVARHVKPSMLAGGRHVQDSRAPDMDRDSVASNPMMQNGADVPMEDVIQLRQNDYEALDNVLRTATMYGIPVQLNGHSYGGNTVGKFSVKYPNIPTYQTDAVAALPWNRMSADEKPDNLKSYTPTNQSRFYGVPNPTLLDYAKSTVGLGDKTTSWDNFWANIGQREEVRPGSKVYEGDHILGTGATIADSYRDAGTEATRGVLKPAVGPGREGVLVANGNPRNLPGSTLPAVDSAGRTTGVAQPETGRHWLSTSMWNWPKMYRGAVRSVARSAFGLPERAPTPPPTKTPFIPGFTDYWENVRKGQPPPPPPGSPAPAVKQPPVLSDGAKRRR